MSTPLSLPTISPPIWLVDSVVAEIDRFVSVGAALNRAAVHKQPGDVVDAHGAAVTRPADQPARLVHNGAARLQQNTGAEGYRPLDRTVIDDRADSAEDVDGDIGGDGAIGFVGDQAAGKHDNAVAGAGNSAVIGDSTGSGNPYSVISGDQRSLRRSTVDDGAAGADKDTAGVIAADAAAGN